MKMINCNKISKYRNTLKDKDNLLGGKNKTLTLTIKKITVQKHIPKGKMREERVNFIKSTVIKVYLKKIKFKYNNNISWNKDNRFRSC